MGFLDRIEKRKFRFRSYSKVPLRGHFIGLWVRGTPPPACLPGLYSYLRFCHSIFCIIFLFKTSPLPTTACFALLLIQFVVHLHRKTCSFSLSRFGTGTALTLPLVQKGTKVSGSTIIPPFLPRISHSAAMKGDETPAVSGWGPGAADPNAADDLGEIVSNSTGRVKPNTNGNGGVKSGAKGAVKGGKRGSSAKSGGKLPAIKKGGKRAPSVASAASRKSGKSAKSGKSKGSKASSKGSKKGSRNGSNTGGKGKRGGKKVNFAAAVEIIEERQAEGRNAIVAEEEFELQNYTPLYNVLMLEMVRSQVEQMSIRQRKLNEAMTALRDEGIPVADQDTVEQITEKLRMKLRNDTVDEIQTLRAENAALRDRLEDKSLELEKKVADVEVLRNTIARKMARAEADNENMRAQVLRVIQSANLDVERMKKELTHRIEICCSSIRTPKYGTALRSMQDLVAQVQEEIQDHRDVLSKLVVSIGAKDTFKRGPDDGETMHSNFPIKYRDDLRKLNKDHLLNVMDVLSFQDGVVETVGKALFVLNEAQYQTDVV
eukprot:gene8130-5665_t